MECFLGSMWSQEGNGYELPYCEGLRTLTAGIEQENLIKALQARTLNKGCIVCTYGKNTQQDCRV